MAVRRVDSYRLANRYPRQAGSYSWSCFDSQLFMHWKCASMRCAFGTSPLNNSNALTA